MSGHVFILQGDLRRFSSDAWLLPSSAELSITPSWLDGASEAVRARVGADRRLDIATPPDWGSSGRRVLRVEGWWEDDVPATWLANVTGDPGAPVDWYLEAVDQFVDAAVEHVSCRPARHRRDQPLLALPVVGTGGGGAARQRGEMIEHLLARLEEHARRRAVDIVLMTNTDRAFAAAQWARRHRLAAAGSDPMRIWPDLSPELVATARGLAADAAAGKLVLFMGAGVSASAGLPLWRELISDLAQEVGFASAELEALGRLHLLDQARIIETRLQRHGTELTERVLDRLGSHRYGLSHGLLACLPIDQAVTTNYDRLFEQASTAAGRELAVLPTEPTRERSRWLLKLHGSLDDPDDIVMTRQDMLRYAERRAALAGIVQSLLITHRMLFVGFSMSDDNFHRIADDVRRSLGTDGSDGQTFGTSLLLRSDPLLAELWEGDVGLVPMTAPGTTDATAARRLEIFLDCLLTHASDNSAHLLDADFSGLLSADEIELKQALIQLRTAAVDQQSQVWRPVHDLLARYGSAPDRGASEDLPGWIGAGEGPGDLARRAEDDLDDPPT
jgi:hypothetical protein